MPPHRIQASKRKGWTMPRNAVDVRFPNRWATNLRVGKQRLFGGGVITTPTEALAEYRRLLDANPKGIPRIRRELRGRTLVCSCPLDGPCHADLLLEIANA